MIVESRPVPKAQFPVKLMGSHVVLDHLGPYLYEVHSGWGGSPKSRQKEQNQLISTFVRDKDGGGQKNPKNLRTSYVHAP